MKVPARAAVPAAGALVLATSCGGIATNSQSSGSVACGKQILIGAPYPLSGVWAENGQHSLHGMELAAREINEAGGIKALNGATIKIVSADTSSDDPGQAKTATEKLLQNNNMSAVVGSYLSSMTLTTVTVTERNKVPLLTQSYLDALTEKGYRYLFQLPPKASVIGQSTMKNAQAVFKSQGRTLKTVAVAGANDASTEAQTAGTVAGSKALGIKVLTDVTFPNGLSDASAVVSKLADAHSDVIALGANLADGSLIIKGLRSRGVTVPILSPGGGGALTPQFGSALGSAADEIMATGAWNHDLNLPGVAGAAAAYQRQYGGFMPQEAGESWVAVHQLAQIMQQDKTCDPQKIRDSLAGAHFTSGPSSAMPPGNVAYDSAGANKSAAPVLVEWQKGQLRTIYPFNLATVKPLPLS